MNVRHALARNTAWYAGFTVVGLVSGLLMSVTAGTRRLLGRVDPGAPTL